MHSFINRALPVPVTAIQVCVDHADGYSVEVFFPYRILNHEIVYEKTFAREGKHEIFHQGSDEG